MSPAEPPRRARASTYREYLGGRWPKRTFQLALLGAAFSPVYALLHWAMLHRLGRGKPFTEVAAVVLVFGAVGVLGMVAARLLPRRHLPALALGMSFVYALGNDWAFFHHGLQGTQLHAVVITLLLVSVASMPPLTVQGRAFVYAVLGVGHLVIELTARDGRGLVDRLIDTTTISLSVVVVGLLLERFFSSHEKSWTLRRQLEQNLETQGASGARMSELAATLAVAVNQLAQTMTELSKRTELSRRESTQLTESSEKLAHSAVSLSERARTSAGTVAEASEHARTVDMLLGNIQSGVQDIDAAVGQSETRFRELRERADRIASFVETVQEIAAQTHTLALNAGIEAARAGEQGKGFAVVATEVRKLAQEANAGATDIQRTVEELGRQMGSTVEAFERVKERTANFQVVFEQTRTVLQGIQDIVAVMQETVGQNARDADGQAALSDSLNQGALKLTGLVAEQARMSMDVAITTDELRGLADGLWELLPESAKADVAAAPARAA